MERIVGDSVDQTRDVAPSTNLRTAHLAGVQSAHQPSTRARNEGMHCVSSPSPTNISLSHAHRRRLSAEGLVGIIHRISD